MINDASNRLINYKLMRAIVGSIAFLLSPVVLIFSGKGCALRSISISYWTSAHDIFVASLAAVSFFMFAYNGARGKRDWEYWLSKVSSFAALVVAFFPTKGYTSSDLPFPWIESIASFFGLEVFQIHYGAAVIMFASLIALIIFFSRRAKEKGKVLRSVIYLVIAVLMGGGIIAGFLAGVIFKVDGTAFWVEAWCLTFFGIGWFIAGTYRS